MKEKLDELIEFVTNITNNFSVFGIITEVVDLLLTILLVHYVIKLLKIKFKQKKLGLYILIILLIYLIAYIFDLTIMEFIIKYLSFWIFGLIIIVYNQEIRHLFDKKLNMNVNGRAFSSEEEKKQVIDTLVNTATYLSERKTGALITIEGKDSLDSIIEKSIVINADVTQEILTTLFYVGTITHDGAVIIRKNIVKCAGAYLPSTDRYDIPKNLGTRHRAAIGISERCDALTIVVSEETGNISVTVNGGIEIGINDTKLRELLEQHLVVK